MESHATEEVVAYEPTGRRYVLRTKTCPVSFPGALLSSLAEEPSTFYVPGRQVGQIGKGFVKDSFYVTFLVFKSPCTYAQAVAMKGGVEGKLSPLRWGSDKDDRFDEAMMKATMAKCLELGDGLVTTTALGPQTVERPAAVHTNVMRASGLHHGAGKKQ